MDGMVHFVYKKVAMVEQFFDIIYSVHVEAAGETQLRGRAGKHCGQKRTYRAVSAKNEVSISSTFDDDLFQMKLLCAVFLYLQFS